MGSRGWVLEEIITFLLERNYEVDKRRSLYRVQVETRSLREKGYST